uniref:Uncharacterized protein n=1 Tax=Oryza meridionalis TaxID=40149 RepID=A0A0E0EEV7_9ORYZ
VWRKVGEYLIEKKREGVRPSPPSKPIAHPSAGVVSSICCRNSARPPQHTHSPPLLDYQLAVSSSLLFPPPPRARSTPPSLPRLLRFSRAKTSLAAADLPSGEQSRGRGGEGILV